MSEEAKTETKIETKKFPVWAIVTTVISAAIILSAVLITGGDSEVVVPGKNGAMYKVDMNFKNGIPVLIQTCSNMNEVGDVCEVGINVKVTMVKKPDKTDPEPVQVDLVKEEKMETPAPEVPDSDTKEEEPEKKLDTGTAKEASEIKVPIKIDPEKKEDK